MDNVEKNYKIAFISDLHFDNISENTDNGISFLEAEEKKAEFIACLKRYFNDYIVCIVGDCYSNYKEMLNFIEELEQNKIYGFFVLGNHDYWSNGQKTYMEIIQFFKEKTNHFSYFRFLCTGKSYKVGELCFIGDTGWTSFKRDRKEVNKQEFNRLPENVFVKDFSCEKIIEMHNAWIEYANQMICKEKKLIILTHFPMVDFTETAYDCWWSSKTRFKIKKNYWNLFGHTHNKKQKRNNWILTVVLLIVSLLFLFPVIWMLANSFKPDAAITADMNSMAAFIPPALNGNFFENYVSVLTNTGFVRYMCNTLFYAAILIVLGVIVNGLAGYALAKINFPFRERWLLIIMLLMIVPMETIITIHFLIIAKLGLLNTVLGYVLPMIVNPFNIFLFRQVFLGLPDDVYEAAQLDYCGPVKYFFTMVLPMSKSVVATVSVFTFLNVWNDYLWPSLVFTSSDLLTAQIGLNAITSNDNTTTGQTLAVITMVTIPVIIIYSLFSKQIVEGVISTGSKEG